MSTQSTALPIRDNLARWREWRHARWVFSPATAILSLMLIVAVFAPLLAPYDPVKPNPAEKLLPPSSLHYFGTDPYGMDVFSRVLYATRTDLTIAISSVLLGILVGMPLGALAGYARGTMDEILMRLTEIVQAFPQILFAMAVMAVAGNNVINLILILALLNVPVYVKMVRSVTLPLRESDFVLAARCAGHSSLSLVGRHILPNTLVPVFSQFSISCAFAVQMVAGLSFIGLGVRVPEPEWGSMINLGASYIVFGYWWPSFFPGMATFLAAFALNDLGQRVRRTVLREL
ncbi:MAG: ABC transporter permease [Caldilineaceae bacterium]|nr:ABC transporter permease [Caldilineaceae bacterium]